MPWNSTTVRSSGFTVTAAVWNDELVENMTYQEEINYTAFTSNVSITATTEGTANQIVSAGAITYEAVPTMIVFSCSRLVAPASQTLTVVLFDSTTAIAQIAALGATSPAQQAPFERSYRITPTAASHTYNIKAYVSGGTGTAEAGAGGAGTRGPGFIRIFRVPT